jgi:hypothetical protein
LRAVSSRTAGNRLVGVDLDRRASSSRCRHWFDARDEPSHEEHAMPTYHRTYTGDSEMPESEDAMREVTSAWGAWFAELGDALVDGGSAFGRRGTLDPDDAVEVRPVFSYERLLDGDV